MRVACRALHAPRVETVVEFAFDRRKPLLVDGRQSAHSRVRLHEELGAFRCQTAEELLQIGAVALGFGTHEARPSWTLTGCIQDSSRSSALAVNGAAAASKRMQL